MDQNGNYPVPNNQIYDFLLSTFDFAIGIAAGAKAVGTYFDIKNATWKPYAIKYTDELRSLGKGFKTWGESI